MKTCFFILLLATLAGCSRDSERSPVSSSGSPVLATVNGRAITQDDFDAEIARRREASADAVMSSLIERQAMLIKAEASGIADTPAFKRAAENRLVSEWLAGAFQKERDAVTVSEDELEAAYNARKEQLFTRHPLARFAILYRKGKNTDELKNALAEAVAAFDKDRDTATNGGRLQGFGKIAADHSEDTVSRYRGGDIGWVGEGVASRVPQEVLDAGAALEVGSCAGPVTAGDGVYVVMKTAVRDASEVGFKEASPALRRRLLSEKRAAVEARFKADLMKDMAVERNAEPVINPSKEKKPEAVPDSPLLPVSLN